MALSVSVVKENIVADERGQVEEYVAKEDVYGTTEDGREYLVIAKGQSMNMQRARNEGLVKDGQQTGPSETKSPAEAETQPSSGEEIDATDGARELAEELGIDLSTIQGSGEGGRILKSDVK